MRLSGEGGCGIKIVNSLSLIEKALVVSAFSIENSTDWTRERSASMGASVNGSESAPKSAVVQLKDAYDCQCPKQLFERDCHAGLL